MDAYSKVLVGNQLYPLEIIEKFGKRHPKWYSMNGREKESHLMHVMLCILLCNQEKSCKEGGGKRKRKDKFSHGVKDSAKKTKYDPNLPSTSRDYPPLDESIAGTSSSTGSTETTEDESVIEGMSDPVETDYRFKMINHMPMKDLTIKEICNEWNLKEVSYQWDLVDLETKRLVRVRYSYNSGSDIHKYLRAKAEVPRNCDMYLIERGETKGRWLERNKEALGESKVTKFLIERELVLSNLGINDNLYLPPISVDTIFPSSWLKEEMSKWEEDLLSDQYETYTESQLYRQEKPPQTITPSDFLKHLIPIVEIDSPENSLKWKGKLLPEPFCLNIQTREDLDKDIVTLVLTQIKESLEKGFTKAEVNMKENSALRHEMLTDLIDIWLNSDRNTFSFMENVTILKGLSIKEMLGIGRKGIKSSPYEDDMVQPDYQEHERLKYSPWIEEVILGMEEVSRVPLGYVACPELMKSSPNDGHPLPTICEPITTEMLRSMLQTNAGVQVSKLTNTYSRLGGAYNSGEVYGKEIFKNVAIFPILATLSSFNTFDEHNDHEDKIRMVSGLIIRAPYHARRPTDKIMIITIELAEKTDKCCAFLKYVHNCLIYETSSFYIVVRQNAVMKEDPNYNSFITTALFTPINMLGCMTLENHNIRRDENMRSLMQETLVRGERWFIERAIEGILFAMIGNARDEGYFACLRKVFLVLLTWRKGKAAASLDIETFCNKANDCLIDNPISFYFHRTLLFILEIYKRRGNRISQI